VDDLTQMPRLLSYAALRTGFGTWYNLVLINDDQMMERFRYVFIHSGPRPIAYTRTILRYYELKIT